MKIFIFCKEKKMLHKYVDLTDLTVLMKTQSYFWSRSIKGS